MGLLSTLLGIPKGTVQNIKNAGKAGETWNSKVKRYNDWQEGKEKKNQKIIAANAAKVQKLKAAQQLKEQKEAAAKQKILDKQKAAQQLKEQKEAAAKQKILDKQKAAKQAGIRSNVMSSHGQMQKTNTAIGKNVGKQTQKTGLSFGQLQKKFGMTKPFKPKSPSAPIKPAQPAAPKAPATPESKIKKVMLGN